MADSVAIPASTPGRRGDEPRSTPATHPLLGYAASAAMVAVATLLAFVVDHLIDAPNLTLVFVLPVVLAATAFGWWPSLAAAALGVLAFDFFFTQPYYSFTISRPSDIWAAALLLVTAAIVSTVAAESRRRALASRQAATQAEALHALAHAIIRAEPYAAVMDLAARSLGEIFDTPAVVLQEAPGALHVAAASGGVQPSAADLDAAQWALANGKATRAETYPFDQSVFDFWPVPSPSGQRLVLGVRLSGRADGRPAAPDRYVDLVAAYLAASAGR